MRSVDVLRFLVRARLLVLAGAGLAAAVGLVVAYEVSLAPPALVDRERVTGRAVVRLQLDGPPRRGATPGPGEDLRTDLGVLGTQARLLADLAGSGQVHAAIARRARVAPADLVVRGPSMVAPVMPSPLALRATAAAGAAREPFVVEVGAGLGAGLPILTIETFAPEARTAERLARAATRGVAGAVPDLGVSGPRQPVIRALGQPRVAAQVVGGRRQLAAAAATLVFATWLGALLVAASVRSRLRAPAQRGGPA